MKSLRYTAIILFATIILPASSSAAIVCKAPDKSFKDFFVRFTEEIPFQQSRVIFPLVYRFGDYAMTTPLIELWDSNKLKAFPHPLILSRSQRKVEGVNQSFLLVTPRYSEVFQDRQEADDYRILYKFRSVDGCWFLEDIHDKAL